MLSSVQIKDSQRTELARIREQQLKFKTDNLEPEVADQLLTDFMPVTSTSSASSTFPSASVPLLDAPAVAVAPPASHPAGPVDIKVEAIKEKMQKLQDDKLAKIRVREVQNLADREAKRVRKQEEQEKAALDKAAFIASTAGKATAFLTGLDRDLEKCKANAAETSQCGMKKGFAKEWKNTFDAMYKTLTCVREGVQGLVDGTYSDESLLVKAKEAGETFKEECKNFRTAKGFVAASGAKKA